MVALESELMLLGHWKNFDDLEENLTLEELMALLDAKRNSDYDNQRFQAALHGHKLPPSQNSKFEEIKERVRTRIEQERRDAETPEKERETFQVLRIAFEED